MGKGAPYFAAPFCCSMALRLSSANSSTVPLLCPYCALTVASLYPTEGTVAPLLREFDCAAP
eukprot:6187637-Pyramimonas_sp.AAC.1